MRLHDIIGPDEYTEHVDNNAYSNYMAHYVTRQAIHLLRDGDGKGGTGGGVFSGDRDTGEAGRLRG